jgi:hypothetical protein
MAPSEALFGFSDLWGVRTVAAEWASILALFVSGYAAITISRVRRQILGRVRLPALVTGLENNAKNLAKLMRDYDSNRNQIGLEMAVCEARLKLISQSIRGKAKATAKALLKRVRAYKGQSRWFSTKPANTSDDAWELYASLNALIEELNHALEDQKVGG